MLILSDLLETPGANQLSWETTSFQMSLMGEWFYLEGFALSLFHSYFPITRIHLFLAHGW